MALVFVCENFARSGGQHHVMKGVPFITRAEAEASLATKDGVRYLTEGSDVIVGEIYEVSDEFRASFLAALAHVCRPHKIIFKNIQARAHGQLLECQYFTLEGLSAAVPG